MSRNVSQVTTSRFLEAWADQGSLPQAIVEENASGQGRSTSLDFLSVWKDSISLQTWANGVESFARGAAGQVNFTLSTTRLLWHHLPGRSEYTPEEENTCLPTITVSCSRPNP